MFVKGLTCICVLAAISTVVHSQCIGTPLIPGEVLLPSHLGYDGLAPGVVGRIIGGNLVVDTSGQETSGVSIVSDNLIIEGTVLISGNLPFLGTVALEGIVPAVGTSTIAYECGTGNIGIASEPLVPNMLTNGPGLGLPRLY